MDGIKLSVEEKGGERWENVIKGKKEKFLWYLF